MTHEEKNKETFLNGYKHLIEYKKEYGNINVPQRYISPDGYRTGSFLDVQRRNKKKGVLRDYQVEMLEELGIVWVGKVNLNMTWHDWYKLLKEYYEKNGNSDVPITYITENGYKLGAWVRSQRNRQADEAMSDDEEMKLNELDMKWFKQEDDWYENYDEAYAYYKEHGDIKMPLGYRGENGKNIHAWLNYQQRKLNDETLSTDQVECLYEIGCIKKKKKEKDSWEQSYSKLKALYKEHNNDIDIALFYARQNAKLDYYIKQQYQAYRNGKLDREKIRLLNEIEFDFSSRTTAYLNKEINKDNYLEYKKKMLEKMKYVLEDISYEKSSIINSKEEQVEIEKEIVKRIWR